MRLFLKLKVGDPAGSDTDRSFLHLASSLSSDLIGTDIDNRSDPVVINLVLKLIDEVEQVLLLVQVYDPLADLGNSAELLSLLSEHSGVTVALLGNHAGADKILERFQKKLTRVNKSEEVENLIRRFAQ